MSQKNPWKRSQDSVRDQYTADPEEIQEEPEAAQPIEEPVEEPAVAADEAEETAEVAEDKQQQRPQASTNFYKREKQAMKESVRNKYKKGEEESGGVDEFWGVDWDEVPPPKMSDFLSFEFPSKLQNRSKVWRGIAIAVALILVYVLYWWFHPALNIHSQNLWIFVGIVVLIPAFILLRGYSNTVGNGTSKHQPNPKKAQTFRRASLVPLAVIVIGLLGYVLGMAWIPGNAHKYASILETQEMDFAQDIEEVNYSQIPIIDRDSASVLGNRAMGTIADYVSQFEIDDLYSQINFSDTPVRVSPLNYANVIKWITNYKTGIPAYCLVDMTTQKTQIVRLTDIGIDEPMIYTPSDPLFRNIDRYVQLKYPTYMFDEKAFEIDDNGTPYWICPVQKRTIGLFGGTTIQKVILCNACTGECTEYDIEDCPEWVDRAYPSNLLVQQYNWYGLYINGWWNSWLGQDGVRETTPGTTESMLGYNYIAKDNDVWLYSGVTSATADDSIIGFVLINQRTAESHFYSVSGATEASAMASAEGQVQEKGYDSTFPLLLNISGQPTYFMALKDAAGLVKKFAMIDIQRYQNVAVGDTVAETQKTYKQLLATNGIAITADKDLGSISGTIETMNSVVLDGTTHFFFTLEGSGALYDCSADSNIDIVRYAPGDKISFSCYGGTSYSTVTDIK